MLTSIVDVADKLLSIDEINQLIDISLDPDNLFNRMFEFDQKLGGAGIHNINSGNYGRYEIKDRDIFRPLQYICQYLSMRPGDLDWVTREIIHMGGLHLESILKRITNLDRIPLGQALTLKVAQLKLDHQLYQEIRYLIKPYNDAKHHVNHKKDSHLFMVVDALMYYVAVRKVSIRLMSITNTYTPKEVWSSS